MTIQPIERLEEENMELKKQVEKTEHSRDCWHKEFERVGDQYEETLEKLDEAEGNLQRLKDAMMYFIDKWQDIISSPAMSNEKVEAYQALKQVLDSLK